MIFCGQIGYPNHFPEFSISSLRNYKETFFQGTKHTKTGESKKPKKRKKYYIIRKLFEPFSKINQSQFTGLNQTVRIKKN